MNNEKKNSIFNNFLTTKQIADAVKVHPNTVRLYEEWGFLRKIPRNKSGYRMFTVSDLNQMKLARLALPGPYPGGGKPVYNLVKEASFFNFEKALSPAHEYSGNIIKEEKLAIEAAKILDAWGTDKIIFKTEYIIGRKKAIKFLDVTIDALRTWERNDLVKIKKMIKVAMYISMKIYPG